MYLDTIPPYMPASEVIYQFKGSMTTTDEICLYDSGRCTRYDHFLLLIFPILIYVVCGFYWVCVCWGNGIIYTSLMRAIRLMYA